MSQILSLTDNSFDIFISEAETPVLVEFWASWCPPCKMMEPLLKTIVSEYQDQILIAKVNVDQNPVLARKFSIMGVPAFVLYDGKTFTSPLVGAQSKNKLQELISSVI